MQSSFLAPEGAALPRRPRIGVDFHTFDGKFQGSRSHLLGLYEAVLPMAPDLDFVFFLAEPQRLREAHPVFDSPRVELVAMPERPAAWRLGVQLPWLRRRHGLDLLHMQYQRPLLPAGPVACTVHDVLFETHPQFFPGWFGRLLRAGVGRAVRGADLLFTVSEFTRSEMARCYGVDPARIVLTTNGVDVERFRPGPEGSAYVRARGLVPGQYLCTVGRIEPRKNHQALLQALALMPRPRQPLVIIGCGEAGQDTVRATARDMGLSEDVVFLDTVDDHELPALVRHAAVFVYPSLAEGFGMPVVEAMASEVAVVTSATTALGEVAGDAALTVDPTDPTDIAAALLALLADPVNRARLARRGRQRAQRYHWEASARALVGSLREHFRVGAGSQNESAARAVDHALRAAQGH